MISSVKSCDLVETPQPTIARSFSGESSCTFRWTVDLSWSGPGLTIYPIHMQLGYSYSENICGCSEQSHTLQQLVEAACSSSLIGLIVDLDWHESKVHAVCDLRIHPSVIPVNQDRCYASLAFIFCQRFRKTTWILSETYRTQQILFQFIQHFPRLPSKEVCQLEEYLCRSTPSR